MQSSPSKTTPHVDSIVINKLQSQKFQTSPLTQPNPYLFNHWMLNERLRMKNEKLSKRQQSACRLAFYSLWLFIIAGVMTIVIYRFTDNCSVTLIDRKQFVLLCLRHILFLLSICISVFACSGIVFGACRYFRSQPRQYSFINQNEYNLKAVYDPSSTKHSNRPCCCQKILSNDNLTISSQKQQNHNDEQSNITVASSLQNMPSHRKMPPFTYEELPNSQLISCLPLPPLPMFTHVNVNSDLSNTNKNENSFSTFNETFSPPPQSVLSTATTSKMQNSLASNNNQKLTLIFDDAYLTTPTSYAPCMCNTDVWERQQNS